MIAKALIELGYSGCQWRISGEEIYENLIWGDKNERPAPTKSEIDTEVKRLQAEYDAQEYARNRQAEYPSLLELTVALYDTDDKSAVEAKRAAVKAKYPKPS
jgi:hypothetical protein